MYLACLRKLTEQGICEPPGVTEREVGWFELVYRHLTMVPSLKKEQVISPSPSLRSERVALHI